MKEFDLEKAKAGAPVCTRNGRKARIICFDAKNKCYPIIALIDNDEEVLHSYTETGNYYEGRQSICDLMMAPVKCDG